MPPAVSKYESVLAFPADVPVREPVSSLDANRGNRWWGNCVCEHQPRCAVHDSSGDLYEILRPVSSSVSLCEQNTTTSYELPIRRELK
jgi:hypothetical protein